MFKLLILFYFFLVPFSSNAQTTAQQLAALRASDVVILKKIDTLNMAVVSLLVLNSKLEQRIKSLEDTLYKRSFVGMLSGVPPIFIRNEIDNTGTVIPTKFVIEYIKP